MKKDWRDLAIFGGQPEFLNVLHVGRPNIGSRQAFLNRVNDMLDRQWLSNNGPYVREFEQMIASIVGVRHCIALCNATVGLELLVRALDLNGEVIVPSLTFVASAHCLQRWGIKPIFCDVDPDTHNLDSAQVEKHIRPETTAILAVHLWGRPSDVDVLQEIARRHGLRLLFDAAHAFGCSTHGRMIGQFGDAEVFSFHATKFLNSFEGGAIVTNSDELAAKLRVMSNFGFTGYDQVESLGTNGKMTEVCAAMGITSLESRDRIVETNRLNHTRYQQGLEGIPGITLALYDTSESCNYQYVVTEFDEKLAGISRDTMVEILTAENVLARRYFYPGCHRMEPYRSLYPDAYLSLQHTEDVANKLLILPTGTAVDSQDVDRICALIRLAVKENNAIRANRPSRLVDISS